MGILEWWKGSWRLRNSEGDWGYWNSKGGGGGEAEGYRPSVHIPFHWVFLLLSQFHLFVFSKYPSSPSLFLLTPPSLFLLTFPPLLCLFCKVCLQSLSLSVKEYIPPNNFEKILSCFLLSTAPTFFPEDNSLLPPAWPARGARMLTLPVLQTLTSKGPVVVLWLSCRV